jgi:Cys-rich protein (TIGR01571 family)
MQVVDAKFTDNDRNAALIAGLLAYCLGCIGGVINRYRLRERLNIKDKAIMDVVFWYCLPCCAATQEYIQVMRSKKGNERLLIWEAVKG